MSWAALVEKAKDVTPAVTEPKRVAFAVEPGEGRKKESNSAEGKDGNDVVGDVVGVEVPSFSKGLLVLDANAFIKGMNLLDGTADALVTTSQVISEVRDRAARQMLERLPTHLHVLEPSKESVTAIVNIAQKTGDLGTLSRTDIRVCALALDCCKATNTLLEPIAPRAAVINPECSDGTKIVTELKDESEEAQSEDDQNDEGVADHKNDTERGDDDDEGWITPENIHLCKANEGSSAGAAAGERFECGVACVTSDYAMQNTLLHVGVPIVGPHGMRIREVRQWLLRCTACFTINADTTRQFCSECGSGNTLRRVQYVVTTDGERQLFINFRKRISTRGTVYNLPKPRGGRRGTNRCLVLREDQLAHLIRGTTSMKMKEKLATRSGNGGLDDDLAAFGEAPKQRKRDPDQPRVTSSYHKYNVNERKKLRAARRK
ncbi:Nin one binding (NOB1) Zn-ribbon like, putative [Trypanosoma equiperdum]|uniref:RNA-binding protein NOB1 n=2 Tax=Trypanozoon TaxID=39700 RepID=Q383J3_TRYB2|nr:hypothetical protein, conserved [Trypanosoma brucei brucei TREU927]EAN80038.1 hypothetical protein, conserved [Trypanosoma brucei brucei TREU927]SCU68562.1 Nin one binding (NOB1) Zn-ribbon like, putative [Trypanosoma equiperdum]